MFAEVNGFRIHYELQGEGRPLILLHGNGEDMSIFDVAVEELKDFFQVVTVTQGTRKVVIRSGSTMRSMILAFSNSGC